MKRWWALRCCTAIIILMVLGQSAFAIGLWRKGRVSEAPWYTNNHHYMAVNNVRYTIMKEAVAQRVTSKKDSVYKSGIDIELIRPGDEVLIQAEGNRIYHIELLQ